MKKDLKLRLVELLNSDKVKFNRYIKFSLSVRSWFKCDLTYADLRSANLSDANLRNADLSYADLRSANLSDANLRNADLSYADLRSANLSDANLSYANLSDADLSGANLSYADLSYADLSGANLSDANLRNANLSDADLSYANLRSANLRNANLRSANLRNANLSDANLRSANLRNADHNEGTTFLLSQCPSEGSFIGWKKAGGYIVKLQITEDSKRSSATTLKCRCSKALVLDIQCSDGTKSDKNMIASDRSSDFIYQIGEIVEVGDFDEDRFNECSSGIHFFIAREMAVKYN